MVPGSSGLWPSGTPVYTMSLGSGGVDDSSWSCVGTDDHKPQPGSFATTTGLSVDFFHRLLRCFTSTGFKIPVGMGFPMRYPEGLLLAIVMEYFCLPPSRRATQVYHRRTVV